MHLWFDYVYGKVFLSDCVELLVLYLLGHLILWLKTRAIPCLVILLMAPVDVLLKQIEQSGLFVS